MADITYDLQTGDQVTASIMEEIKTAVNSKVDIDGSKVLSDNNYTNAEKTKVSNLPANTNTTLATKQDNLVSSTNIKTINGETILGSGDLEVTASAAWGDITGTLANQTDLQTALTAKQSTLVSGSNIKTVNGSSLLGSGDVAIVEGAASYTYEISGSQLFDKDTMVTQGMVISDTTGLPVVYSSGANQAYATVPITPGRYNVISFNNWSQNYTKVVSFFDDTDTLISFVTGETANITVPGNAAFIRFTVKISVANESQYQTLMLSPTAAVLPYEAPVYVITAINGLEFAEPDTTQSFSMATTDTIIWFGCSYTESNWAIKNKAWISRLQDYTNYRLVNYGWGSHRVTDIVAHFRANDADFGVAPWDVEAKYAILGNIGNQSEDFTAQDLSLDFYKTSIKEWEIVVRDKGLAPLLTTDWLIGNSAVGMALDNLAQEMRIPYWDIGSFGQKVVNSAAAGSNNFFFGLGHPGTRASSYAFLAHLYYFQHFLPEPSQSIFIARPRFTVTDLQQLNYDGLLDRPRKWQALATGNVWITGEYDNLTSLPSGGTQNDEYHGAIQAGSSISFTDYALVEVTLPVTEPTRFRIKIKMASAVGIDFYLKDFAHYNDPYTAFGGQSHIAFYVSKAVYDTLNIVDGDTYTHSNQNSSGMDLRAYGKMVDWRFGGYIVAFLQVGGNGFTTIGDIYSGTLTRATGTGTSSFAVLDKVDNRRYTYLFRQQMLVPHGELAAVSSFYEDDGYVINAIPDNIENGKAVLVINKSGAFSITDVEVEYDGGKTKQQLEPVYQPKSGGTELLSTNVFDTNSLTSGIWDKPVGSTASIGQISSTYRDYPNLGVTHHLALPLMDDNLPARAFTDVTFAAASYERKLIIRVVSRLFPKVYSSGYSVTSETTNVVQITPTSYEQGTLCVAVYQPITPTPVSGDTFYTPAVLQAKTDIGWTEQYFEVRLPAYDTDYRIELFRDHLDTNPSAINNTFELQIAFVSVAIKQ